MMYANNIKRWQDIYHGAADRAADGRVGETGITFYGFHPIFVPQFCVFK
jgi:hypothetical protein